MVQHGTYGAGLGLALAVGAFGCAPSVEQVVGPSAAESRPQVVATTRVVCDLTQQVAAETIDLTCLIEAGQDPHTYQARPSDRQVVDGADLVLYDGYNVAPAVLRVVMASPNPNPKVAVLEAAVPNPLMGQAHDHDHGSEDHGDAKPGHTPGARATHSSEAIPDPHIWHSAPNNAAMVEVIATALAQINPDQASRYQARATELADQFMALDGWIQTQVNTVPASNRRLVTTHDAFRYFAEAYGFEVKGALSGLSTEAQPSPRALAALVDQIKAATVPAIFAESTTNPALIETVAKNAGVAVAAQPLMVEGPGTPDSLAPTTQAMLVVNTCTIVNALGGTCTEGTAPLKP